MRFRKSKKYKLTLTDKEMMFLIEWVDKYKHNTDYNFSGYAIKDPTLMPIPLDVELKLNEKVYGRERAVKWISEMFEHQPQLMLAVYNLERINVR